MSQSENELRVSQYPYPGLRALNWWESDIFFGRDTQTNQLLTRLAQGKNHFLAVLGYSGSGKSSLVRAGLLASLEAGLLQEAGIYWRFAEFRPGEQPFTRLAHALLSRTALSLPDYFPENFSEEKAAGFFEAILRRGPLGLHELLKEYRLPEKNNLLLIIDQFEELFRYVNSSDFDTVTAFIQLLLESCRSDAHPNLYVVITLRSEYMGYCARFNGLPEAINEGNFLVPRLSQEQLRQAIERPAKVFHGQVEEDLTQRILNDMADNPMLLPPMQYVLFRMWWPFVRDDTPPAERLLTLKHYLDLGGLTGALNSHAEEAYQELDEKQQEIARILFQSLAEPGELGELRRPMSLENVARLCGENAGWEAVAVVVEHFRRRGRRFLQPRLEDIPELKSDTKVEVVHESVLKYWERLAQWIDEENQAAKQYVFLEERALRYKQEQGELLTGLDLDKAVEWRDAIRPTVAWAERYGRNNGQHFLNVIEFIDNSQQRHIHDLTEEANRKQREFEQVKREKTVAEQQVAISQKQLEIDRKQAQLTQQKFKEWITALGIGLFIALVAAGWGWYAEQKATRAEQIATRNKQEAEYANYQRTQELYKSTLTDAALFAQDGRFGEASRLNGGTHELDDKLIASPDKPALLAQRDLLLSYLSLFSAVEDRSYLSKQNTPPLLAVALSPDGRLLAGGGEQDSLIVLDTVSGEIVQNLSGEEKGRKWRAVAFDPQKRWLVAGNNQGQIHFWPYPGQSQPAETPPIVEREAGVIALAISPDGRFLASIHENDKVFLSLAEHPEILLYSLDLPSKPNASIEPIIARFSPDSRMLAVAGENPPAILWDISGPQPKELQMFTGTYSLAFSPDSRRLASLWPEGVILHLRDTSRENPNVVTFGDPHISPVYALEFLDDTRLASAGRDTRIQLWDVASRKRLRTLYGHAGAITGLVNAGNTLYSSSNDGTLRKWSTQLPGQRILELKASPSSIALFPQNSLLALGYADGSLELRSLEDLDKILDKQAAHASIITRIAFSADGQYLLSGGYNQRLPSENQYDGLAKLWKITDKHLSLQHEFKQPAAVSDVALSQDSRLMAVALRNGEITLFDNSGQQQRIQAHEGGVYALAFAPDGQRLLSGGVDGAKLWQVNASLRQLSDPRTVVETSDLLLAAAFSPDGKQLAVAGRDQLVRLYDADTLKISGEEPLRGHISTIFRLIFSPNGHHLFSVSADATVRAWPSAQNLLNMNQPLFTLNLPAQPTEKVVYDLAFACLAERECWMAAPLYNAKRLVLYHFGRPVSQIGGSSR